MNIHIKKSFVLAVAVLLLGITPLSHATATEKISITAVGANNLSGTWHIILSAIGKAFTDRNPDCEFLLKTGAGAANVLKVNKGQADVSYNNHGPLYAALNGKLSFKNKKCDNIAGIARMDNVSRVFFVCRESVKMTSLYDIKDKKLPLRVGFGLKGSINEDILKTVFAGLGFTTEEFKSWGGKILNSSFGDCVTLMKDGQMDLFMLTVCGETTWLQELATTTDLRFLPVEGAVADYVCKELSMDKSFIPGTWFGGMPGRDIPTISDTEEVYCRKDMSEEAVYRLTKAIIEGREDIALAVPAVNTITPEGACKNNALPLHPGAIRYYKEAGLLK